jgi:SAM-dependent methyltransferase
MASPAAAKQDSSPYALKPSPYSSHSLMLGHLPAPGAGHRVLDVGGGEGYLTRILAERGYDVTCLAAPGTIAGNFPANATVLEADLDIDTPAFAERFSVIICGDVLEHLRNPAKCLRWLQAQLAPGGRLIASLPNSGHWYFRLMVLSGRFPADDRGLFDRTHLHFYTWSGWSELFHGAGFKIETVEPSAVPFGFALNLPPDHIAVSTLERLSYGLGRLWKTLFAYQFVVVTRPHGT